MFTLHEYHAGPGTIGRELLRSEFSDIIKYASLGLADQRYHPGRHTPFGSKCLVILKDGEVYAKVACRQSSDKVWKFENELS